MAKIGIFDSGVGGLTVVKAVRALLPQEEIVYFGDTARIPYGTKSQETVIRYSLENAAFLLSCNIDVLVIACHTASALALETLQKELTIPLLGVIQPSIEQLLLSSPKQIAVIGTSATIASNTYQKLLQKFLPQIPFSAIACPLFVPLVEEGFLDHPLTALAIEEYLKPLKASACDTLLLGCTHYPLLTSSIQKALGPKIKLIDPGVSCAQALKTLLPSLKLESSKAPSCQFFVSDDPEKFRLSGERFLKTSILKKDVFFSPSMIKSRI